ncbi:hypothetical protein [Lolliginicoccus levis]|uniref:hypothetical protein n=1 Tax=Lolliginicoccus levis TaxID=2919542 RepID=UPI002420270A|nr:hypothetical protein [Lolliginicoccus levis]
MGLARGIVGLGVTLGGLYLVASLAGPLLVDLWSAPQGPGVCTPDVAIQSAEFDYPGPTGLMPGASAVVRGGAEVCLGDPSTAQTIASYVQWWTPALWIYGAFVIAAILLRVIDRHGAFSPRPLAIARILGYYLFLGAIVVHVVRALVHWTMLDGVTTTWADPWSSLMNVQNIPWAGLAVGAVLLLAASMGRVERSRVAVES